MKANIRIYSAALGLTLLGLTGCETTVEEPAVTTTTTQTTEVRRTAPAATTETRVIQTE